MSTPRSTVTIGCFCNGPANRKSNSVTLCPACVKNALKSALEKRAEAEARRNAIRNECAETFQRCSRGQRISQLSDESKTLRKKLSSLREECADSAVKVAAKVVENDERRGEQEGQVVPLQSLARLNQALYDPHTGAMTQAMHDATERVRKLRFQWAVQVFSLFRLDVDKEEKRPTVRHRHAHGVGKIAGLPLPHAGPELYGVLPENELQSVLRLVACLTSTVARCLGIVLPHPILLQPHGPRGDITETVKDLGDQQKEQEKNETKRPNFADLSTSTASLLSIVNTAANVWGRSTKKVASHTSGKNGLLQDTLQTAVPPSMDSAAVSRRLRHASSAVLAEDSSKSSSTYALSQGSGDEDQFAVGLQLLQNDVVALCIRAGVPVAKLWPAEAMLLNLHALLLYSQEQVATLPPLTS